MAKSPMLASNKKSYFSEWLHVHAASSDFLARHEAPKDSLYIVVAGIVGCIKLSLEIGVTRSELIKALSLHNQSLFEKDIALAVRLVFDQIIEGLLQGQRVEIRGFGSFSVRLRAARSVRNPKTGAVVQQKPNYVLHFKAGKELRERVNKQG